MQSELTEIHLLDEHSDVSLLELVELSGLSREELQELIDDGTIPPINPSQTTIRFSARWVITARTAHRLRQDFDLNTGGVTLSLSLIARIHELEAELCDLRAQLPRQIR
jgi:chaperone modulatory protein CbpM